MSDIKNSDNSVYVNVYVKPGSRKGPLVQPSLDGELTVFVREPAIEGRANQAVVQLLADFYRVPKSCVKLIGGISSRQKRFQIIT